MKRRCRKSKTKSNEIHAKKRAFQRTGHRCGLDTLNKFVKLIQNGEAEFIDRQSNNRTRWFVKYAERKIAVVYDKQRKSIITVLTEDMI